MPTVHRAAGLRLVIYVDDHPPPHIHVEGKGGYAKIAIDGPVLVWNRGVARSDMKIALDAVTSKRNQLLQAWTEIHG